MANNTKGNNQKNGRLSLQPLEFGEAVRVIVKVKPETKDKCASSKKQQEEATVK